MSWLPRGSRWMLVVMGACLAVLMQSPSATAFRYSSERVTQPSAAVVHSQAAKPRAARPADVRAAAVALTPCDHHPGRLCGEVPVPLDRANPGAGTVAIHFEIYPHTGPGPADEAILVTEGGPGFAITTDPFIGDFLYEQLAPLLEHRDLILLDQRGVGRSAAVDCPSVQAGTAPDIYAAVAECAAQLGAAADLYGSGDVALDIEAVRQALGIEKLNFIGASYAGVDVQAYAARFPSHLRSVILDTPVRIVGSDPFAATSPEAIERAVELICKRSANCRADHSDADEDLEWLAKRLRRRPVDGIGFDAVGEPHDVHVTEAFLAKISWNDAGGYVSVGEIAAAADSLRDGDKVPLLRLAAENDFDIFGAGDDPTVFSSGHGFARQCTDLSFPWRKSASIDQRRRQWDDAVDDLDRDVFDPFSIDAWLAPPPLSAFPDPCIVWPTPQRSVEPAVPPKTRFADVPALVLSADLDTGTTSADSRQVAKLFPQGRFIELANSGHHTLLNSRFDCAASIVNQFVEHLSVRDKSCATSNEFVFPALGRYPEEAEDARPATGSSAKTKLRSKHRKVRSDNDDDDDDGHRRKHRSKRTDRRIAQVAAVSAATVIDAVKRTFLSGSGGVGLRGGTFTIEFSDTAATMQFDHVRFAADVAVSGSSIHDFATDNFDVNVTVDGPRDIDGTLNISGLAFFAPGASTWQIRGTLGGRPVELQVPVT